MSAILNRLIEDANVKPVHGVTVGTFGFMVSESSEFPMDDTSDIYAVATLVKEKYGDRAYGFRRCYYLHGQKHFVDKGWMFIQGRMRTAEDVVRDNLPDERILRENIHDNGFKAVISFGGQTFEFKMGKDVILNMTKKEKLLPCPFCGGDNIDIFETDFGQNEEPYQFAVKCKSCGALVSAEDKADAIAAWNRRAK